MTHWHWNRTLTMRSLGTPAFVFHKTDEKHQQNMIWKRGDEPMKKRLDDDSIIGFSRKDKVMYVGDAISGYYYNNNHLNKDKIRTLKVILEQLDFELCITGNNESV